MEEKGSGEVQVEEDAGGIVSWNTSRQEQCVNMLNISVDPSSVG